MTIFNISKESVRDKCIIAPESRVRNAVHAQDLHSQCCDLCAFYNLDYSRHISVLREVGDSKTKQGFIFC